jgi:putative oxidoreductase
MDIGLLLIHFTVGALLFAHGVFSKLRHLDFQAGYMESIGLKPGRPMAVVSGLTETVVGAALMAGFATPFAAAGAAAIMLVAARTDHRGKGLWIYNGGWEYVLTNAAVVLGLAFNGAGAWSVDAAIGWDVDGLAWGAGATAAALAGGLAVLGGARLRSRSVHALPSTVARTWTTDWS